MPLSKLKFSPGINRDTTDYSNAGGWYDCNKIRFRNGLPEKIGGWQKFLTQQFDGTAREIMRWASLNGTIYTGVATNTKVYINGGSLGSLTDVTPWRRTVTLASNPFTTTNLSTTVKVTDAGHGCQAGDYVTFSGAIGPSGSSFVNGIPIAQLNKEHIIQSVLGSSEYTILVTTAATSSATGGGVSVVAQYQVGVGLDTLVFGTGWGAGPFGGAASPFSTTTLGSNPIATDTATNASSPYARTTLTLTTPSAHGLVAGDSVALKGVVQAGDAIGGVDLKFINGPDPIRSPYRSFQIVSVPDVDELTIYAYTNASSSTTGGGSAITMLAYKANTSTGWGQAANESTLALQLRLWSLDNYGEDLLMNPRDGGLYYWVENTPAVRGVPLYTLASASHVPAIASKVIVSEIGSHVIAFGASPFDPAATTVDNTPQNKMLIRFSSDQRPEYWNEADTTENAGSIPLSNGSFIMTAEQTRQEILVWTDTALYSLQYKGTPYIFTASLISSGIDIIGPNSAATAANTTFWMGSDNFYYYDGTMNRMPCTVREKVFPNLNFEQRYKVFAAVNAELNEIIWFYPSNTTVGGVTNTENDSYVIYNYAEKCWYYGTMPRTCWADRGFGDNPIAASSDRYLYSQEVGADDGSTNPPSPITAYITSSPVEIEEGDHFGFITRIIPDVSFRQTPDQNPVGEVDFTLYPQNYPGGMPPLNTEGVPTNYYGTGDTNATKYNYSVKTFTQQLFTRIRGRSAILRVASDGLGVQWRLGTPRLDIRTDGRR
jgi:hypothetical protein